MCTSPSEVSPASSYPGSDGASLIPWLKGLGPASSAGAGLPPLHGTTSSSAPVTPPLSSPTGRGPPVKPDWDGLTQEACGPPPTAWNHHPFLAAAAAAAHLRPGYCDTPDGARTPVDGAAAVVSPTALEFACSAANSSKWANGVRVRAVDHQMEAPFPWRKSISMPVSPVSSRMKGSFGLDRVLGRCPSELELAGGLGSLWERDELVVCGAKRKLSADDLELTLGSSSLRASPERRS